MRISDLFQLGERYLKLGIVAVTIIALAFFIGYFFVYKRMLKGQKRLKPAKFLWWMVLGCYAIVVIGATLMGRSGAWENQKIMPLFYSYRDAWVDFSVTSWRNIILNICMFVPLGFLIPVGMKKFRCFWKTYLMGFGCTLVIELAQLLLGRGMFELDDLLNNTVGAMIGYGAFVLTYAIYVRIRKYREERSTLLSVSLLQLPLVITILVFSMIFITYEKQELGNVNVQCILKHNPDLIHATAMKAYSDKRNELPVYTSSTLSKEETTQFAQQFFQGLGAEFDEERKDFYNETAFFYAKERYNLSIDYAGGTYSFTDFDTLFSDNSLKKIENASEREIREALKKYSIIVPEQAEFKVLETGEYQFTADMLSDGTAIIDGTLTCVYYNNGCFSNIHNSLISCCLYKQVETISEQEAYERICSGEFRTYESGELDIQTGECKIGYVLDTKGFYQPVYEFSSNVNGVEETIGIVALQ